MDDSRIVGKGKESIKFKPNFVAPEVPENNKQAIPRKDSMVKKLIYILLVVCYCFTAKMEKIFRMSYF